MMDFTQEAMLWTIVIYAELTLIVATVWDIAKMGLAIRKLRRRVKELEKQAGGMVFSMDVCSECGWTNGTGSACEGGKVHCTACQNKR